MHIAIDAVGIRGHGGAAVLTELLHWLLIVCPERRWRVFPSLSESFGLGLVESMASGCPIVAADLPYAHDVAEKAVVYFHPKHPASIAETIVKTLGNEDVLKNMREAAKERLTQYHYQSIA